MVQDGWDQEVSRSPDATLATAKIGASSLKRQEAVLEGAPPFGTQPTYLCAGRYSPTCEKPCTKHNAAKMGKDLENPGVQPT